MLNQFFKVLNTKNEQHSLSSAFSQPTTPRDFIVFIALLLLACSKYLFSYFVQSKTIFYWHSLIYYKCILYTQKIIQLKLNYYNDRLFLSISYVSLFFVPILLYSCCRPRFLFLILDWKQWEHNNRSPICLKRRILTK